MRARPFEPGNSLSPGRPRGARAKLARKFLEDCYSAWERDGEASLKIMAKRDPVKFCQMLAAILPREIEFTANMVAEIDDAELEKVIENLRAQIAQQEQLPPLIEAKANVERQPTTNGRGETPGGA
jgi:hypothetical protein